MSLPKTPKEAFKTLLEQFEDVLSNNCCNDFEVANTPEIYDMLEKAAARNLRCSSIEAFHYHLEYNDYKPDVNESGTKIYTQDFVILECLIEELNK